MVKVGWKVGDTDLNWLKKAKTRQKTEINENKKARKNQTTTTRGLNKCEKGEVKLG